MNLLTQQLLDLFRVARNVLEVLRQVIHRTGIQRIHVLKDVVVLAGAGVGGGSLVYANTLYVPGKPFFDDPQWSGITDWADELAPYYDQAARMLGVVQNPTMTPADRFAAQ